MTGEAHVQRGNTVRLTAVFKDWGGDAVDPDMVKVVIYNREWQKIDEVPLGVANRLQVGEYFYDYVAAQIGTIYVEWYGMIGATPSLHRSALTVKSI